MADDRKIVIEIKSSSSVGKNDKKDEDNGFKNLNEMLHPLRTGEKILKGKSIIGYEIYNQTKQLISQTVSLSVNRYFSLAEDYMGQNSLNNISNNLNRAANFSSALITAIQTGNPISGGLIMAGWGVSQYIQNQSNLSGYYESINASNYNTQFSRIRAGLVNNGRGTEN